MAVSDDMIHWQRFGKEPVVANGEEKQRGISGDPQIVRMGDLWVMFYFGAFWQPGAFDTFACSTDLVHWTKWTGPHLIEPSEPWDKTFAHKPWVIKHDGVVYHFYCAVGDQGRVIALATSQGSDTAITLCNQSHTGTIPLSSILMNITLLKCLFRLPWSRAWFVLGSAHPGSPDEPPRPIPTS